MILELLKLYRMIFLLPATVNAPDKIRPKIGNLHRDQIIGGLMMKN